MLSEPVPLVIRNAPTGLMKDLNYGKGYVYAHDTEEKMARMECLPESLKGTRYYHPTESGEEKAVKERLEEKKILIKTYGQEMLKDYIRISTGSRRVMEQFTEALYEVDR